MMQREAAHATQEARGTCSLAAVSALSIWSRFARNRVRLGRAREAVTPLVVSKLPKMAVARSWPSADDCACTHEGGAAVVECMCI